MKIAWTTYSFAGLPGTAKRPVSVTAGGDRLAASDASLPSKRLGVAILRHLRAIDEMASEIMNMTGGSLPSAVEEYPGQALANAPRNSAIARGDVLVFLPGPSSGREGEDAQGELVVVKGIGWPEGAGLAEGSQEEVLQTVAKDVAEAMARRGFGLVSDPSVHDPSRVREKFIISVDAVDGAPVATVIRHAQSGAASVYNNGGGEFSGGAIPREVAVIAGLLSGAEEEVPMEHLQRALGVSSEPAEAPGPREAVRPVEEDVSRMTVRSFLSDPGAAMRDAGRMLQRLFVTSDGQGEGRRTEEAEHTAAVPSDAGGPTVPSAAGPAPVTVTFMGQSGPAAQASAAVNAPIAGEIAGKVLALSDAVNEMIAGSAPDIAPRGDGAEKTETEGEGPVPLKEAMRRAVAASFAGALKELTGMDGRDVAKSTGLSLDERGLLKVDAAVLREALSAGKGETLRFVHDLTSSLHDRIAYNPLACAGLHTGSPDEVLEAPSGNERAAGDDADRKASFEKRLNELQMLLKSSYELKDSFMHGKFVGGEG